LATATAAPVMTNFCLQPEDGRQLVLEANRELSGLEEGQRLVVVPDRDRRVRLERVLVVARRSIDVVDLGTMEMTPSARFARERSMSAIFPFAMVAKTSAAYATFSSSRQMAAFDPVYAALLCARDGRYALGCPEGLGHSDPNVTAKIYAHLVPGFLETAVNRLPIGKPAIAAAPTNE
jgi:hypothetical protein